METLALGILALLAFFLFLGLFFWSSGALAIHQEEKEIIGEETPQEVAEEIIEEARREVAAEQEEKSDYDYSRG